MDKNINETQEQCTIHSVVRSLRFNEPKEDGWLFDSNLILKIKERAKKMYDDEITMEHVEAVLLAISDLQ